MALVLLMAQVAPACAGVGAGVVYSMFHQLEHAIQAQLTLGLPDLPELARVPSDGLNHTHGPDSRPHRHGSLVHLALHASGPADRSDPADGSRPGDPVRTDRRVAPHVPSSVFAVADPLPAHTDVRGRWGDTREPPSTSRRPLVPPPRV